MSSSLLQYYTQRAREYERIYERPERTSDLEALTTLIQESLTGEQVLEIACGTGYWTTRVAAVARSVCATDAVPQTLEMARQKTYPAGRVRLQVADAYAPELIPGEFTAAFGGFWWSHIPREQLSPFLRRLHRRLGSGARVVWCDNRYVERSSTPILRTDAAGNSYQRRHLESGEVYEVLKNFPTADELAGDARAAGSIDLSLVELTYYWFLTYRIGAVLPN